MKNNVMGNFMSKQKTDISKIDTFISEITTGISSSDHNYVQVPFRIYENNFIRLEALKNNLGTKTRNKLLNELLEIALDELSLRFSRENIEFEFEKEI